MSHIEIKAVLPDEIDGVMEILADAKQQLKSVSFQWQYGYPNRKTMTDDIDKGRLFGAYLDGTLAGFAAIIKGTEPDYIGIEDGSWVNPPSDDDIVVHRVAVKKEFCGHGIAKELYRFAISLAREQNCRSVKGDTHRKNVAMQRVFASAGLKYRGVVHDGNEVTDNARMAYEYTLESE